MKCEVIKDLLPLYIDGITSEVSAEEIEMHLKTCSGCQQCYLEMSGRLPDILPKTEADSVEIIKKAGKKRKCVQRLAISALTITGVTCLILGIIVLIGMPRRASYDDVLLVYGVTDNPVKEDGMKNHTAEAYVEIRPKAGKFFDLCFSGSSYILRDEQGQDIGNVSDLIVNRMGGTGQGCCRLTSDCSDCIAEWTFVFSDKIVVIRNGELVSVDDVEQE